MACDRPAVVAIEAIEGIEDNIQALANDAHRADASADSLPNNRYIIRAGCSRQLRVNPGLAVAEPAAEVTPVRVAFTLSLLTARFVFKNWFLDELHIISASPQSAVSGALVGTFYSLRQNQQVAPIRLNDCVLTRGDISPSFPR